MIRNVRFEELSYEDEEVLRFNSTVAARLRIDPPMDATLIQKIIKIKGSGWVEDQVDYADIRYVSPEKILLSSGCPIVWCHHMQNVVRDIVETLKQESEVNYEGPSIYLPTMM